MGLHGQRRSGLERHDRYHVDDEHDRDDREHRDDVDIERGDNDQRVDRGNPARGAPPFGAPDAPRN